MNFERAFFAVFNLVYAPQCRWKRGRAASQPLTLTSLRGPEPARGGRMQQSVKPSTYLESSIARRGCLVGGFVRRLVRQVKQLDHV